MAGRKTKLTEDFIEKAAELIRDGNYVVTVCKSLGVSEESWYNWKKDAQKEDANPLKVKFLEAITRASQDAETEAIRLWRKHFPDDWRAIAEFMARRYPKRWTKTERHEHTGKNEGPIEFYIDMDKMSGGDGEEPENEGEVPEG